VLFNDVQSEYEKSLSIKQTANIAFETALKLATLGNRTSTTCTRLNEMGSGALGVRESIAPECMFCDTESPQQVVLS